jgi:serine/threonine protein kinase
VPIEELDYWDRTGQWSDQTQTVVEGNSEGSTPNYKNLPTSMPARLGPFDIIEEIASGGMGVVYRGRHHELKRDVAVKCLRAGLFVHRDLKPRNILIDREHKVWVTDFGLAKSIHPKDILGSSSSDLTAPGEVIGTPSYMAPEQLYNSATVLSDVYSLGAVLYAGLTGRPPHQAATLLQTLKNISESEPVAPRVLDPQMPRDLETITLKALHRSASERYLTAQQLAEDLERYLEGRPVLAKATSSVERIWRWVKREPTVASLSLGVAVALLLGLGISVWFYSLADNNERIATANANLAMASVEEYLTNIADSPELREQGLEGLRRNLLSSALAFYEQLSKQSSDRPILNDRIAQAHFRLGLIHAELGDIDKALAQFDKVLLDYRVLWKQDPEDAQIQRLIAETLEQQSQLHKQLGQPTTAVSGLIEAIGVCRSLVGHNNSFANRALLTSLVTQLG